MEIPRDAELMAANISSNKPATPFHQKRLTNDQMPDATTCAHGFGSNSIWLPYNLPDRFF